jgi:predicted Zn-dependent protease
MINSSGVFAYNTGTNVNFNVTLRTEDGNGSGYATKSYNDISKLDVKTATSVAADKAIKSVTAKQ